MINILGALRETIVSEKSLVVEKCLVLLLGQIWFGIEKDENGRKSAGGGEKFFKRKIVNSECYVMKNLI